MTLRQKRCKFSRMFALLILFAIELGYEVSIDDVKAHDGHSKNSFHYKGLAGDLNLYRDGRWLKSTEAHRPLGEYWEGLGGSWGGRFRRPDGGHYSFGE